MILETFFRDLRHKLGIDVNINLGKNKFSIISLFPFFWNADIFFEKKPEKTLRTSDNKVMKDLQNKDSFFWEKGRKNDSRCPHQSSSALYKVCLL